jgi:hypothetical protein
MYQDIQDIMRKRASAGMPGPVDFCGNFPNLSLSQQKTPASFSLFPDADFKNCVE